jgi:hypothetical protein
MHAAKIDNSARLKRVLDLLKDGREHSTRDIVRQSDVCAVNSIVGELRENGFKILCRCLGRGRYVYRLVKDTLF